MEKNFFEERLKNASQSREWKIRLNLIIIATVIAMIGFVMVGIRENILSILLFGASSTAVICLIIISIKREEKIIEKYSGDNKLKALILYDKTENVQDVYDYINNAVADNKVLFRHRAFPKERKNFMLRGKRDKNNETIILPKYLLDCTYWTVMVIPIYEVRVVAEKDYFECSAFNYDGFSYEELKLKLRVKNPIGMKNVVSIYYGDEKAIGIDAGSKNNAEKLAQEINICLNNNKNTK